MTDDHVRRWLTDDLLVFNALLIVAVTSLTIALTSYLWLHLRTVPDKHLPDDPPSIISAALASLHLSFPRIVPQTSQQHSPQVPVPAVEQKEHKSTRSKERRRRAKDPFRDLFKGGKKSKALLKAINATDHDHSPLSPDMLSISSVVQTETTSSASRSASPEPQAVSDVLDMNCPPPRLGVQSDDGSARCTTPNGNTSSASAVTTPADISDNASSHVPSQTDAIRAQSHSMTVTDAEANVSFASAVIAHASEDAPSSPSSCVSTLASRDSQAAYISESCAKLVRARTKLRLLRMDPSVKSSLLCSSPAPLPDSAASPSNAIQSVPCSSLFITPSTHSIDGAGPFTPTNSRRSTPPLSLTTFEEPGQWVPKPLDENAAGVQMELASMRSALEAARLREEESRVEAEQARKERDELQWGWNEDAGAWRRREEELQAQIHHLVQQLQAYAAIASFQAQQAPSPFSLSTPPHPHSSPRLQHHPLVPFPLPPAIQPQNSASAPAHVQALLATAPMLTSHPPGFAAPSGGLYPGGSFGMSPLLWSGMGLCVPNRDARHGGRWTPDSSASGSSSRGRGRWRHGEYSKSASDESSLGDWEDGSGEEEVWEEEEVILRNNALADAILKRPESIRELGSIGKRAGGRPFMPGMDVGAGERMDAVKDPALEKPSFAPVLVDTSTLG